jgi:hypothetical protein
LLTVAVLIVIPEPMLIVVTPAMKFVPLTCTLIVLPRNPDATDRLTSVGTGLLTVNPPVNTTVPPPGAGFVTVTSLGPPVANDEIVTAALNCVGLLTVTVFTVIPAPTLTVV